MAHSISKDSNLSYVYLIGAVKHVLKTNPSFLDRKIEELKSRLLAELTPDQLSELQHIAQSSKKEPESVEIVRALINDVLAAKENFSEGMIEDSSSDIEMEDAFSSDDLSLTDSEEYDAKPVPYSFPPYTVKGTHFGEVMHKICQRKELKFDENVSCLGLLHAYAKELDSKDLDAILFALLKDAGIEDNRFREAAAVRDRVLVKMSLNNQSIITEALSFFHNINKK